MAVQEVGRPTPPLRHLVRAGSSSSANSQQSRTGNSQAPVPKPLASASLAQAAKPAASIQAAGTAAAAPSAAVKLLKPQMQSQPQPGKKAICRQLDLSAQHVGEYQEQPDEDDVDILGDSPAVPPIVKAQEPVPAAADNKAMPSAGIAGAASNSEAGVPAATAEEAAPHAGIPEAAGDGAAEAQVPTQEIACTPLGAGNAPAEDAARPLPASRL